MIVVDDVFVSAHLFDAFSAFAFDSNSVFWLLPAVFELLLLISLSLLFMLLLLFSCWCYIIDNGAPAEQ